MSNISITQHGGSASVIVDGVDVARGLRGLDISMEAGNFARTHMRTRVTLDVTIVEDFHLDTKEAIVIIPDAAIATLVALGWTAPEATA